MSHIPAPPFAHTSGPRNAKIAIVGEAFGQQEEIAGIPFVGASGQELTRILHDAGINRSDCFLTNVFAFRPPGNNLDFLCGKKREMGKGYWREPLGNGKYVREEYIGEVDRLQQELSIVSANITIGLGAVASWALINSPKVGNVRGTVVLDKEQRKVLVTYHPAGILRNWSWRTIAVADLMKAKWHSEDKELHRKQREALIRPTLEEVHNWAVSPWKTSDTISVDIETWRGQIESISFANSETNSICIPFLLRHPPWSYWETLEQEIKAWRYVGAILFSDAEKLFQNGLFDVNWLWREMGLRIRNAKHDTMLLHHAIFPEIQKGLGFLGSIYCDEPAWKQMADHADQLKREE